MHAFFQQPLQRRRHVDGRRVDAPGALQAAAELLEIEGVPTGSLVEALGETEIESALRQGIDRLGRVLGIEGLELDARLVVAQGGSRVGRAGGGDPEDRVLAETACELAVGDARSVVGPLPVVDEHDQRAVGRESGEEGAEGEERRGAALGAGFGFRGREAEQSEELERMVAEPQGRERLLDAGRGDLRGGVVADRERLANEASERREGRDGATLFAVGREDGRADGALAREELLDHAGLAEARVADERDAMESPPARLLECRLEAGEGCRPPDEGGEAASSTRLEARRDVRATADPIGIDRRGVADRPRCVVDHRIEERQTALERAACREDLVGRGPTGEAGRGVRRVTDERQPTEDRVAAAHQDETGLDSRVHASLEARREQMSEVEGADPLVQLECRLTRSADVVFVRVGVAEDGEHPVAVELDDGAVVTGDDGEGRFPHVLQHLVEGLGVELLAEPRRAAQVREEDRQMAAGIGAVERGAGTGRLRGHRGRSVSRPTRTWPGIRRPSRSIARFGACAFRSIGWLAPSSPSPNASTPIPSCSRSR